MCICDIFASWEPLSIEREAIMQPTIMDRVSVNLEELIRIVIYVEREKIGNIIYDYFKEEKFSHGQ
jgi:hypothetical protein